MHALTLIQPWATAIMQFGKDIENRPWAPWPDVIGKRIAIHAGKKVDTSDTWNLMHELGGFKGDLLMPPKGCILGTVELVGAVRIEAEGCCAGLALACTECEVPVGRARAARAPELHLLQGRAWVVAGARGARARTRAARRGDPCWLKSNAARVVACSACRARSKTI